MKCDICGRSVEKESLREHMVNVHKVAKGESLIEQKARQRRKSLKIAAIYGVVILAVAISAAYFLLQVRGPKVSYGVEVGDKAAPFRLIDLSGIDHTLIGLIKDRPLMVEFMWTKCPHCQSVAPVLAMLHGKWSQRVKFVSIAGDPRDSPEMVRQFASAHRSEWPHLMGGPEVMKNYGIEGYPTFFFIGKNGLISGKIVGAPPAEMLETELKKLAG